MLKIQCSRYSDLDDIVIAKASEMGLPLIGGTALEIWAGETGHFGVRTRSQNDLDFIASDEHTAKEFGKWVRENIDTSKVKVDVMLTRSVDFSPYVKEVHGVKVMSLPYILWSKLSRASKTDLQDIKWILTNPSVSDDELNDIFADFGLTKKEESLLMNVMDEIESAD